MELITPTTEEILAQYQKPTLVNARIQGAINFLKNKSIKEKKSAIFQVNSILRKTSYQIL